MFFKKKIRLPMLKSMTAKDQSFILNLGGLCLGRLDVRRELRLGFLRDVGPALEAVSAAAVAPSASNASGRTLAQKATRKTYRCFESTHTAIPTRSV